MFSPLFTAFHKKKNVLSFSALTDALLVLSHVRKDNKKKKVVWAVAGPGEGLVPFVTSQQADLQTVHFSPRFLKKKRQFK